MAAALFLQGWGGGDEIEILYEHDKHEEERRKPRVAEKQTVLAALLNKKSNRIVRSVRTPSSIFNQI